MLLNLLRNALDAMTATDPAARRLSIRAAVVDQSAVEMSVCDSGEGVHPDARDKLFDAFFTTKPKGLGMGLSISRSIVEAHGGRVWVTPNPERGTTFWLRLPLAETE